MPKIFPEDVPYARGLRDPQLAEQLVEVPTIFSYASLSFLQVMQRIVEQNVDIPVPRPGGAGDLQGLPPWTEFNSVFGVDRRVS